MLQSESAPSSSAPRILLAWSSGKDSAWTLHMLRQAAARDPLAPQVVGLLTTVNATHERVAMHAVRRELLAAQAAAAGLPLREVLIPWPCSNADYERAMSAAMETARAEGLSHVAFGDLFLEDIRRYREEKLAGTGLSPLFPLWGRPTRALAEEMLAAGVRAHITTVDPRQVPARLVGRRWDAGLIAELPPTADPCGENGEFHTFVSAGPMFRAPIPVRVGEVVTRDGFVYADLLLDGSPKARHP
ncbi:MAG: ATP-binding protein [Planctomycetota bacterium]